MKIQTPSPSPHRPTAVPSGYRVLFIVSRDLPERYESLAYAFDGDHGARVIFDRRRADRRRRAGAPTLERRQEDRRSAARDSMFRAAGWVRIDGDERPSRPDWALALEAHRSA
jgi:hypothetical protein